MNRRTLVPCILLTCVLASLAAACAPASRPVVVLAAPPQGSQYQEGEEVAVQSTATDSAGISRVELLVDDAVVRTDSAPQGQLSFSIIQTWKATTGTHILAVRATNTAGTVSGPAIVSITVNSAAAAVAPQPTATRVIQIVTPAAVTSTPTAASPQPTSSGCTNSAAFITDVTVPEGALFTPGQTFNKVWRVRNSGTCIWGNGYQLAFVGGQAMSLSTSTAVTNTMAGTNADLVVPMVAPSTAGVHLGQWRLKTPGGAFFGPTLTASLNVSGSASVPPPPGQCTGEPNIAAFAVSPSAIAPGGSATLSWGPVTNAESAAIDQKIGGVAMFGSLPIIPGSTTTYILTARCGANAKTAQTTVTVAGPSPAPLPDLFISAFTLAPSPPRKGATVTAKISVYNAGNAASGATQVRWIAGTTLTASTCEIAVPALQPHASHTGECSVTNPYQAAGSSITRAHVDYSNAVAESNEDNNVKDMTIQVAP